MQVSLNAIASAAPVAGPRQHEVPAAGAAASVPGGSAVVARGAAQNDTDRALLSEAEQRQVRALQQRDREVRAHEQAHLAAAGGHARGGPTYHYQRGPDGRNYAVGGEVQIDTSAVPGDPEATLRKMESVQRAAMAPADPSAQDRAIATEAASVAARARVELQQERAAERHGGGSRGDDAVTAAAGGTAQAGAGEPTPRSPAARAAARFGAHAAAPGALPTLDLYA